MNAKHVRRSLTFRTGVAGKPFIICMSCSMDDHEPTTPYSPVYIFDQAADALAL